ncbi:MAG: hypothetical protein R6U32_04460 [Candidatus Woesearchaeota archaeon]
MGVRRLLGKVKEKAKEKDLEDRIRETIPKILGAGTTLISYEIFFKNATFINDWSDKVFESPFYLNLLNSIALGFVSYRVLDNIMHRFLYKAEDKNHRSVDKLIEENGEKLEETEPSSNVYKKTKNPLLWLLKHPKSTSLLITSKFLYTNLIKEFYEDYYKPFKLLHFDDGFKEKAIEDMGVDFYIELTKKVEATLEYNTKNYLPIMILGTAGIYIATLFSVKFADLFLNPKYKEESREKIKVSYLYWKKDYKRAEDILENKLKINPKRDLAFDLGDIYAKNEKMDWVLRAYSKGINIKGDETQIKKFLDRLRFIVNPHIMEYKKIKKEIRKNPIDQSNYYSLAALHWRLPSRHMAFQAMEDAEERCEDDPKPFFLHGEMLEHTGRDEEAEKKYTEGGAILLEGKSVEDFSIAGEFRNELLLHKFDKYIQNLVAIKRNMQEKRLRVEKEQIRALKPYFGDRISDFLCDLTSDGHYHIFLRYIEGKNLHQMIHEGEDGFFEELKSAVVLLRDIEDRMMDSYRDGSIRLEDCINFPGNYFKDKSSQSLEFIQRSGTLISDGERMSVERGMDVIGRTITPLPKKAYTDSNLMNFMKDRRVRKIDFENDEMMPPFYFFVNLCEFSSEYLDEEQKEEIKELYWGDDYSLLNPFLPFGAVQRHMEMAGYRSRDLTVSKERGETAEWAEKARRFHVDKAIGWTMSILEDMSLYEKYIGPEGGKDIEEMVTPLSSIGRML